MERLTAIGKENLRFNFPVPFFICVLLLALSPLVLGIENLDKTESVKVVEFYLVFLGMILFIPVFLPEQNREIRELVSSKYTRMGTVYLIRILSSLAGLLILQAVYLGVMRAGRCSFPFWQTYFASLSGMIFLGGLGVLFYALTDQIVIGYMIPILYYVLCIGAGMEKMGVFYLFSMSAGKPLWKLALALAGTAAFALGVGIRVRRD